ncbi:MAG: lamin tail domain-containing protein, partial [Candidatus Zophobacter franzmannii]|nr:lamin tail domain-containing protein [Candidatus Zophobacter franzmannii]
MKTLSLLVMLLCIYVYANCSVVINEICYDPISSDEGYEWIELYNNGSEEINLIGWQILSGGDEFVHDYTFPAILIRPGRYILIAEEFIDNAHLHTTLNLQNATDAVDGVRLISASGDYTDTILYGENNANNLIDDNQVAGVSFAPDTSQGSSLYRNPNGNDTNLCADDFLISQNPTPGYRNVHEVDLMIKSVETTIIHDSLKIYTSIFNLSTSDVDNSEASLRICLDGVIQFEGGLNSIISLTCIDTVVYVQYQDFVNPVLSIEVIHEGEQNIVDNLWTTPIFTNDFEVYINELCPAPTPTNQE